VLVLVEGDAIGCPSYSNGSCSCSSSCSSSAKVALVVIVFCSSSVVVAVVVSVGSDRIVVIFWACALLAAAFALKKFSMVRVCERVASGTPVQGTERREVSEGGKCD